MWTKKGGGCNCHFCTQGIPHKHTLPVQWSSSGRLQVAESLDPNDIIRTRVCNMCGHEERS